MDSKNSTAVSLDELTFELTGDDSNGHEVILADSHDSEEPHMRLPGLPHPDNEPSCEMNVEFGKSEDNNLENGLSPAEPHEIEDFDLDVPVLSLFPNPWVDASDSSDSEFEVPDRPKTLSHSKQTNLTQLEIKSKSLQGEDGQERISHSSPALDLNQTGSSYLQPEILTPRNKVSADLSLFLDSAGPSVDVLRGEGVASSHRKDTETNVSAGLETSSNKLEINGQGHGMQEIKIELQPDILDSPKTQDFTRFPKDIASKYAVDTVESKPSDQRKPSIVTTAEDWEDVQTIEPGFAQAGDKSRDTVGVESKPLSIFSETWDLFAIEDYTSVKGQIKTHIERHGFSAFTHLLFGPPKMSKDLLLQRELVFCIAATQLENGKESHIRVLQTVYRCLTGSKFDCQRFGSHWEEIGFQGRDPATDLRGTGMLALLQLLFFLRDPSSKELARDVYKLSLHPTQNFPFCIMGINLSRICLQLLREDVFNRACNRRKDVVSAVNDVYAALFLQFYKIWKQGKTIADSGFVLQEVESYGRKHSKTLFKDLTEFDKLRKQQGVFGEVPQSEPAFFSVCKEEKCDDKSPAELY